MLTVIWHRPSLQGTSREILGWLGCRVLTENTRLVMITNRYTIHKVAKRGLKTFLIDLQMTSNLKLFQLCIFIPQSLVTGYRFNSYIKMRAIC